MTELNREELLDLIHSALGDIVNTLMKPTDRTPVDQTIWGQLKRIADSLEELNRNM